MLIYLDPTFLENYPHVQIGYLVANVKVLPQSPIIEDLKETLYSHLLEKGLDATTFTTRSEIKIWRDIYQNDFLVKPKTYRSSLESLVKRILGQKKLWQINSIVDAYNCASVFSLLPMGGYDYEKIQGDLAIRYAKNDESFMALGALEAIQTKAHHVVYADEEKILCWLWNHKDAESTGIDEETQTVLFFIDGFDEKKVLDAAQLLKEILIKLDGKILNFGLLNRSQTSATLPEKKLV